MSVGPHFYQKLSSIIRAEQIPGDFAIIEDGVEALLDNLFFSDAIIQRSATGDSGYAYMNINLPKDLGFGIGGTNGIRLLLNPNPTGEGATFPISFRYEWKILKYKNSFNFSSFDGAVAGIFDVFKDVAQVSDEEFFSGILSAFSAGNNSIINFVAKFNSYYSAGDQLNIPNDFNSEESIFEILKRLDQQELDPFQVVYDLFIADSISLNELWQNLAKLFQRWIENIDEETLLNIIVPKFNFILESLKAAIEFPDTILKPVDPGIEKSLLTFTIGSLEIDSVSGFNFKSIGGLEFTPSKIANTNFTLGFSGAKLDLSRTTNIPEADADGRPKDFIGVYIQDGSIGFPTDWNHNPDDPENTAELFVNNFLAGTGGISGTIGMRGTGPDPDGGLIKAKFGSGFEVGLEGFELVFQQNAIISSDIHGWMKIPGMKSESGSDAVIDINIHIGQDGEFNVVATAIPALKKIKVPGAFEFGIESVAFGREQGDDGRFYLGVSGVLDITVNEAIGQFLPDKLDIKKMLIYDDGTFEFEGGKIVFPKAYEVKFGVATLSVTGIHMGAYEKDNRKYKFFGFDGGVKVNPGGVEAHGKGIKYYYTVDDGDFDWFIRLESLSVDIIIPSGADPENAAVTIKGFLSISEPRIPADIDPESPTYILSHDPDGHLYETLKNSQEYAGGVSVKIPKFKGLEASAAMRLNPKVPAFIIDLGIEISTPILLGTTGLGIYGFRALLGKKYVATKPAAGVPEDGEWWQYYKAKIDPDFHEGIQVSKFDVKNGFSFGAGVSLATASDSGKTFSSKLFFLLSLPDVFLFQGQAQFLKERIGLDANPDPPFYAIIAITKHSVEAGFGVNYKLRDEGKLVTVDGVIELGFFWGNSSAWYVNIGRETPEDRRIQARLFDILNMYFYLMLSSGGIRLGAGVKFEKEKKFGPLSAELKAYIDTFGKISRRPKQIGGAIKMGGKVGIKVCGFGFSVSGGATLAAEAPMPHIITGEFEVCVKVLKKERCARFEFTWDFDDNLDRTRIPLLGGTLGDGSSDPDPEDAKKVAKMTHMVTGETYPLAYHSGGSIGAPDTWISNGVDDYRVPVDAFMDIEFKKGVRANAPGSNNLGRLGGLSSPAKYVEFSPPVRGKSDRVRHEFSLDNIEILYWDETSSLWKPYDFYNAMIALYESANPTLAAAIAEAVLNGDGGPGLLNDIKWGYWQQQDPGINNKLRLLATTPLSFAASSGDAYTIEDLGINDGTILCPGDKIEPTCVIFGDDILYSVFHATTMRAYEKVMFRVLKNDGRIIDVPFAGFDNALFMLPGDGMEIFFSEPMREVSLLLNTTSEHVEITYYNRKSGDPDPLTGLPTYSYSVIKVFNYDFYTFGAALSYESEDYSIDYVTINSTACPGKPTLTTTAVSNQTHILDELELFLNRLIGNNHLTASSVELYDDYAATYSDFFASTLYERTPKPGDVVMLTNGHVSPVSLSFTISDNYGFECLYQFRMIGAEEGFDFGHVTEISDLMPYTANNEQGANNEFEGMFHIIIGGVAKTIRFVISTCKPLSYSVDICAIGLYKTCYLSMESYLLNQTIPSQSDQQGANHVMFESINKTLQPIWRPNTAFAVRLKTTDTLFLEGSSSYDTSYQRVDVYGFRTAGPIGHFHQYPVLESGTFREKQRADFHALDVASKADEYRLTTLRPYIDYAKSYPNADGSLINAKPLFYMGAELKLFYLYNHVYHFYNDWVDYDHLSGSAQTVAQSSLSIRILNPAPSSVPEMVHTHGFEAGGILHAASLPGQPPVNINSIHNDVSILNNLLSNGSPCVVPQPDPLVPIDISSQIKIDLKPLKLYTAQFVANYNARIKDGSGFHYAPDDFETVVHSYVFQTSRYGSFAEQVNSYILKETPLHAIVKAAVFPLEVAADVDLVMAKNVLIGDIDATDELRVQYAEPFDQLVCGVLGVDLNQLQTAVTTEFNLVKSGGQLIGILIRNPEPFNDPKIPENVGDAMLSVTQTAGTTPPVTNLNVLYSKDRSQMFVTRTSFALAQDGVLDFVFRYKKYNGISYFTELTDQIAVQLDLTNYPI